MLYSAFAFLVAAIVTGVLGFGSLGGMSADIAKGLSLVMLVSLLASIAATVMRKI